MRVVQIAFYYLQPPPHFSLQHLNYFSTLTKKLWPKLICEETFTNSTFLSCPCFNKPPTIASNAGIDAFNIWRYSYDFAIAIDIERVFHLSPHHSTTIIANHLDIEHTLHSIYFLCSWFFVYVGLILFITHKASIFIFLLCHFSRGLGLALLLYLAVQPL